MSVVGICSEMGVAGDDLFRVRNCVGECYVKGVCWVSVILLRGVCGGR